MPRDDWLVGGDRRKIAAERIYAAATDMITHGGPDAFDIDTLAKRVHCSRATIYRYVGGKKDIREAVLARAAARIIGIVRESVEGRTGPDRILTAIEVAVATIRSDPAGQLFVDSARGGGWTWLTASAVVADFATELTGLAGDDARAARWILRLVLSLLFWPEAGPHEEHEMLDRFVAPAFTEHG